MTLTAAIINTAAVATTRTRRTSAQVAADNALIERIVRSIETNPRAVVKALETLYARQTADEQHARVTVHHNRVGFSAADADTGAWLVDTVIAEGREKGRDDASLLRGKALAMGRRIALKYARTQLFQIARDKRDAEAEAARHAYTPPTPAELAAVIAHDAMMADAEGPEGCVAHAHAAGLSD